jgi:taurine--2-oxoglutarate transaminase
MPGRAPYPYYLNLWYAGDPASRQATPASTFVRSRGMTLTRADGRTVEDWFGQYFVNNIGAGRGEVARAMAAQARRMSWVSPGAFADVRLALTRDLLTVLPRRLTTPQFGIGGSDGIENAVRAARLVTGRTRVLTFSPCYHGDTMTVENLCGFPITPYGDPRPWAVKTPSAYELREGAGGDWERAGELALERAERTLERHGPRTFAAMVVEPVMWNSGAVPLSRGFARGLRVLCDRHGIKLIADEVVTGFGRTGRWFGSQTVGLVPDAIVCAKGITGGYAPLGAIVFERSWGAWLRRHGFNHGLTFGGHPVSCAAARATIRILKRERLVERAASVGRVLQDGLEALRRAHPDRVAEVRGRGLLLALELAPGRPSRATRRVTAAERVASIAEAALRARSGDGSALLFMPPFIVTRRRIDRLLNVLDRALRDV